MSTISYLQVSASEGLAPNTLLSASYSLSTAGTSAKVESGGVSEIKVDLSTETSEDLVAGSLKFTFAGNTYIDRSGVIYKDHDELTDSAAPAGSINYQTGEATLTAWAAGTPTLTLSAAVSTPGTAPVVGVVGRTPGAPLSTGQFQMTCTARDGTVISLSADNNGDIVHEWAVGHVDWNSGVFRVGFGKMVLDSSIPASVKADSGWYDEANVVSGNIWSPLLIKPETIKFNAVLVSYIPLDADILGVDTVRLPLDGRVPVFRQGDVAVVHNTQETTLPNPASAGATYDLGRVLLSFAKVFDANGLIVATSKYTANLDAGTITMAAPLDLAGYVQPLVVKHRIEDSALVSDVQITGEITLQKPVRHIYPSPGTFISSALIIGTMQARVTNLFDQETWTSVFSDELIGAESTSSYNDVLYPLVVTNKGCIQERWAIVFTGSTAFDVYGEYSGLVAQGSTGADLSPINPITSTPYFTMLALGFGTGWNAGNVIRFNTIASNYPIQLVRTTLQSDPVEFTDHVTLQIRGDTN